VLCWAIAMGLVAFFAPRLSMKASELMRLTDCSRWQTFVSRGSRSGYPHLAKERPRPYLQTPVFAGFSREGDS